MKNKSYEVGGCDISVFHRIVFWRLNFYGILRRFDLTDILKDRNEDEGTAVLRIYGIGNYLPVDTA
jgi:hypothetical protein